MNTVSQLDILPTSGKVGLKSNLKKSANSDNDLFQSILGSLHNRDGNGLSKFNLYADNASVKNSLQKKGTASDLRQINRPLNKTGKGKETPEIAIPDSLTNQLILFLKDQGFSLKEINQLISSSRNKEGLIKLDSLFTKLTGNFNSGIDLESGSEIPLKHLTETLHKQFISFLQNHGHSKEEINDLFPAYNNKTGLDGGDLLNKNGSFINTSNIPQVEELLFKMGILSGDVKKLMEKCINGKGELEIGKLTGEINKLLKNPVSESNLVTLLMANDINVTPRLFNKKNNNVTITDSMINLDRIPSKELQNKIKQNIATLLKEKGIPEQEVKSFLSSFDINLKRMKLNKYSGFWKPDSWNERILGILKNEKVMISGELGKNWFQENGELKLDIAELIKNGKNKITPEQLLKLTSKKTPAENSTREAGIKDEKSFIQVKENLETSDINLGTEKNIKIVSNIKNANTAISLPQPLPKVLDRMMWMIRTGEQKSRIHIRPPELGRLDIDLTIKNGHLQANMSAESIIVKEIIEANLNQLKQQLSNHGLTVDKFDVMVGLDNRDKKDNETWAGGKRRRDRNSNSKSNTEIVKGVSKSVTRPEIISSSQVDVHV